VLKPKDKVYLHKAREVEIGTRTSTIRKGNINTKQLMQLRKITLEKEDDQ
jgi:predicted DNA-binding antitoxin AbrB/MazE fold protein